MSEAPSQPEKQTSLEDKPARIHGAPEAMQLENLDTLVGYRDTLLADLKSQGAEADDDTVSEALASQAVDYLNTHGYDEDNYTDEENDFAVQRLVEVMKQDEAQWLTTHSEDFPDGTPEEEMVPRRNVVYRKLAEHYGSHPVHEHEDEKASEDELRKPSNESVNEYEQETIEIRKKFAEMVAERSKRSFERAKKTDAINGLREELSDMIGAVATEMMLVLEERGMDKNQIATEIDMFIGEHLEDLTSEIEAERAADYEKRSPFVRKMLDKWASWGEPKHKFLSKDRFKGNLKKAAVFAVPGAAIGALAAPLVGAIGGGIVAGGLAAAGARSIGRHLMGARLDRAANAKSIAAAQADESRELIGERMDLTHTEILTHFDEQSEKYRKLNKRRLLGGTAIAMAAGILGGTIAQQLAHGNIGFGKAGDAVGGRLNGEGFNLNPETPEVDAPAVVGPTVVEAPEIVAPAFDPEQLKEAVDTSHSIADYATEHVDGTNVTAGEGWYQTFREFGVPSQYRDDLLKEIGPQLEDMGVAYKTSDGLWGITDKGALPDEANRLIIGTAAEHGWVDLGDVAETAAPKEIIDTHVLEKGHGIVAEAQDFGIDDLSDKEINTLGQALTDEGTGYKSQYLADTYGSQYGLKYDASSADSTPAGELTPEAHAIFNDFADNRQLDQSIGQEVLNTDTNGAEIAIDADKVTAWVNSGDVDKLNMMDKGLGRELGQSLDGITYANGVPVAQYNAMSDTWTFNDVPYGLTMPNEAKQKFTDFVSKHTYDLAA